MTMQLNHTIVWASDPRASARFLAKILGRPEPSTFGHFVVVQLDNHVQLDFAKSPQAVIQQQHYAFLVSEPDFDGIFARIRQQGVPYWADPGRARPGQINHNDGGRGVYFADPDDHLLEAITRPYGAT